MHIFVSQFWFNMILFMIGVVVGWISLTIFAAWWVGHEDKRILKRRRRALKKAKRKRDRLARMGKERMN